MSGLKKFIIVSFILVILFIIGYLFGNQALSVILTYTKGDSYEVIVNKFALGEISYQESYNSISKWSKVNSINDILDKLSVLEQSKQHYNNGIKNMGVNNLEALSSFSQVIEEDLENYQTALTNSNLIIEEYINNAAKLAQQYFYDEAIDMLLPLIDYSEDNLISSKIDEYNLKQESFVLYDGKVNHIFFHSLIAVNELAFDGDYMENGYNYWMTTTSEFKEILNQFYEKGYILIDIHMLYDVKIEDGKKIVSKKDLFLPEGKKPLVISLDDQNYYEYMKNDGFSEALVLDEEGNVATRTFIPGEGYVIKRDYDCIPILDVFVENHPDFSYKNAKGIIALTGYEGILGYRTNILNAPDYEDKITEVSKIVERLKETGWIFASHSYGHINVNKTSLSYIEKDTERWDKEVGSIVGPTDIYIYAYGSFPPPNSPKLQYLVDSGFNMLCGVSAYGETIHYTNSILMNRINLDGYRMMVTPEKISKLIDVKKILDKDRPKIMDTLQ